MNDFEQSAPDNTAQSRAARLSPREEQVARLILAGLRSRAIAARLGISIGTVHKHIEHIKNRLAYHTDGRRLNFAVFLGESLAGEGTAGFPEINRSLATISPTRLTIVRACLERLGASRPDARLPRLRHEFAGRAG